MQDMTCDDCGTTESLRIAVGDFGAGAFIMVLCDTCWHRRQYRAELERRKRKS